MPTPRGELNRKDDGRRWCRPMDVEEVRRECRPGLGLPKDSSETAAEAGVGGVWSPGRACPRGRGTILVCGETFDSSEEPSSRLATAISGEPVIGSTSSAQLSSPSSSTARTSARYSATSRAIASRSSSIVSRLSTCSHLSNREGHEGSSASSW